MSPWAAIAVAAVVLSATALALALWRGAARWEASTARLLEGLRGLSASMAGGVFREEDLRGLPTPVSRYFRLALREGQPLVRRARLLQRGQFNLAASAQKSRWRRLQAEQHFSAGPPGFLWDARIRTAPLMAVRVRDAYIGAEGSMLGKLLHLFTVVDEAGKAELNEGALQRYLAEAVWLPTALLPSRGVRWTAVDDTRALAELTDAGTTVSLEFHFNEEGEVSGVFAPGRHRAVGGKFVPTPWAGRFRDYQVRGGMRVPLEAEAEWQLPEGALPYWRGRIVEIEYEYE